MAASKIETVLQLVQSVLMDATAVGTKVSRGRADALDRAELPAINIRRAPADHQGFGTSTSWSTDQVTCDFDVDIEVAGENWETLADAIHVDANAALFQSPELLAMCPGLRCLRTDPTGEGGDGTSGRLTARYQFQTTQRRHDLT